MKKSILLTFYLSVATMLGSTAQVLKLTDAKFQKGDNMEWKNTTFDDSRWQSLSMLKPWTDQGISNPNNYAWYRYVSPCRSPCSTIPTSKRPCSSSWAR